MNDLSNYSDQEAYRVARLIAGYIRGTLSKNEHDELDEWVAASDDNMKLFERLTDEKNIGEALSWMETIQTEKALREKKKNMSFSRPAKTVRLWQWAVAASVIIAAGFLILKLTDSKKINKNDVIAQALKDLPPGTDNATLTLANGKIIVLTGEKTDSIIGKNIKIHQGEVVYKPGGSEDETEWHLLTVPRKARYKLVLPDGTKVWLNSESSIKYPTAFTGKERRVMVTGETFFEVAKAPLISPEGVVKWKPFIVESGGMTVEALGTQFNINSYSNEPFQTATLIEGSVLVTNDKNENILRPGQQAKIKQGEFTIVNADTENVTAWKNDLFRFTNEGLDVIMRQVERWYDAEVVYQDKPDLHFNFTVERNIPVSKLLHFLEETGQVHFRIEGRRVVVSR